ncbi:hypothetical protein A33Q_4659 [Indibacter alkaliphilus LW1]|uniref:Uncharacterized protein n=1 Tax=Indibacter alkaliphilus (strain CCUG 57479 / KCTC 22604 / LW1) TaxID=1189612 RepID=S2DHS3_INDAL|nr:hypothetical protein [Indibacter alkaliphilus]EOZ91591.1 hypothetical protein A33Q_4659 [Indibacter alkaliphilus LW1]
MKNKKGIIIQKKNPISEISYVLDSQGIIGTLKLPFFNNSAIYTGKELYNFYPIDIMGNSFRVYREGKSIGYIHLHALRNLAQINLVEEGPFQFSLKGIFNGDWVLRQGKISLERIGKNLYFHHLDPKEKEHLLACGLFTAAKINKDLIIILPFILLIWTFLILV